MQPHHSGAPGARHDSANARNWVATLGQKHGARERAAALAARAALDGDADGLTLARERWFGIVAAMRRLAGLYNIAFDRDVLAVVDDRSDADRPVVTVRADGSDAPSLEAVLEGTLICVRCSDAQGQWVEMEHRLRADRDDEQTAAYVLQHWMEPL